MTVAIVPITTSQQTVQPQGGDVAIVPAKGELKIYWPLCSTVYA
jgi:hypothetical protein